MKDTRGTVPRLFGELLIIVAGVLIALGVDSWNSARHDGDVEADYLRRLAADIQTDTAWFGIIIRGAERKTNALERVADVLLRRNGAPADTTEFLNDIIESSSWGWQQPEVRRTTVDDLLSPGNIRLISSRDLRAQVAEYYSLADAVYRRIDRRRGPYPATTYALLPRAPDQEGDEFSVATDRYGLSDQDLIRNILESDLRDEILAEMNLSLFIKLRHLELRAAALELLSSLEARR